MQQQGQETWQQQQETQQQESQRLVHARTRRRVPRLSHYRFESREPGLNSGPLYQGGRFGYLFPRAAATYFEIIVLQAVVATVLQLVDGNLGQLDIENPNYPALMIALGILFVWRCWAEATGHHTLGRYIFHMEVSYPEPHKHLMWRVLLRNSWLLVPILAWVVFVLIAGLQWDVNPYNRLWIVLFLMCMLSRTGAHMFDRLANARVIRAVVFPRTEGEYTGDLPVTVK